jgi:aryl-alcohol dehydrogenase-like predicted oxidoreductase
MDVVQLGSSSLRVPVLAVGAMWWGTRVARDDAHALLDRAVDAGAHFVDTANNYAFWEPGGTGDESETCLGDWFARRGPAARDRVVLATKVGARPARAGAGTDDALGLGRQAVLDQVAASLRRLRTPAVDVVYAHVDDARVPLAETLGALQEVVDRGWAWTIAASNLTSGRLREAAHVVGDGTRYAALQNRFTFLPPQVSTDFGRQVLLDADVQAVCQAEDVAMVAYSTLLEGAYTRPDRPLPPPYQRAGTEAALDTLTSVADDLGLDRGQTVLAWLVHREARVIPVVGISHAEQLDSAVRAVSTPVPEASLAALESARGHVG